MNRFYKISKSFIILILVIYFQTHSKNIDSIIIQHTQNNDSTFVATISLSEAKYLLNDSTIKLSYYQDLKELLYYFPGVFIYELGSFGYNHGVMINYLDSRNIEILNNSISMNDPLSGTIDVNNYTVEDLERIEYINGTKSFLYGYNSNSGVLNLIKKKWFYTKTYSKIRYSESAYEETSLDGIYSNNFRNNWNITIGFRRNASDGRYTNSEYDAWNLRFFTNYSFRSRIQAYFSAVYNQNKIGANGGIDMNKTDPVDAYDRLKAFVLYESASQKISQNDLQLCIKGNLFNNSSNITSLLLFLSNRIFYFNNLKFPVDNILNYIKNHTRWMGVKFDYDNYFSNFVFKPELKIGLDYRSLQIMQSSLTDYKQWAQAKITGDLKISPTDIITINLFSRILNSKHKNTIDAGLMVEFKPYNFISINLGHSRSHRIPYEIEQIFNDSYKENLSIEKHNVNEIILTLKPHHNTNISISYLKKDIYNAIIIQPDFKNNKNFKYSVSDKVKQNLVYINTNTNIWKLEVIMNFVYNIKDIYEKPLQIHPKLFSFTELFFKDKFLNDKLSAKLGLRGRYYSEQNSYRMDNRFNILYPNFNYKLGNFSYLDAILFLQIGDAIVNITLENILDNNCTLTYYYPLKDRSLRLGINWKFEN